VVFHIMPVGIGVKGYYRDTGVYGCLIFELICLLRVIHCV